jgi:hypothetical protein
MSFGDPADVGQAFTAAVDDMTILMLTVVILS